MVMVVALALLAGVAAGGDCACLANGGQPGPGDCPCDVGRCFAACVAERCPGMPECMLDCSRRCACNAAPAGCSTHVDPDATPTAIATPRTYSVTACYSEVPSSWCSAFGVPYEPPSLRGPIPSSTTHAATRDATRPYPSYTFSDLAPGNYILGAGGCNPFGCRIDSVVTVADEDVVVVATMVGPRPSPLFRICGSAAEQPGEPTPASTVHAMLLPSRRIATYASPGIFCFREIPPGDYLIVATPYDGAPSSCTAAGCWQDTPVHVDDADVVDVWVPMDPLPTATPTPCLGDRDGDRLVTIDELVGAVANALDGCR